MLVDLARLIELQQVDLRLRDLTDQIALFPKRRAETEAELTHTRQALEQARHDLTESLKARKRLELDVKQFEEKISKHKSQIFEVKSNDAYRALQHEIETEERGKAQAEDRVLEAMIAAEELEQQIKNAEERLKEIEQRVSAALRQLDAERAEREQEAAAHKAERESLRGQIAEDKLVMYDRIAHTHHGIALAQARDEVCLVCRIHIRPQTFTEVKRNDEIRYCESCHRILYFVPPPAAPEPNGVAARVQDQPAAGN